MFYKNTGNIVILNRILKNDLSILDVGCGAGDNAEKLYKKGRVIDGITLSEREKEIGSKYMRDIFIFNLENGLPSTILNRKYDVVICSHVLEHICWPKKLLDDIRGVLKSEGKLLVALPNIMHYNSRIKLLKGDFEYTERGIMDKTHFRWYTFASGKKLLIENGFTVYKAWVDGHLPFYRFTALFPSRVRKFIKEILFSISKGLFGEQLFYEAKLR